MKYTLRFVCCLAVLLLAHDLLDAQQAAPFLGNDVVSHSGIKTLPSQFQLNSGIRFIENKGQIADTKGNTRPDIKYYTESTNGVRMYFSADKISYVFAQYDTATSFSLSSQQTLTLPLSQRERERTNGNSLSPLLRGTTGGQTLYRMDMSLLGASPTAIEREGESEDYNNYYYAHCPHGVTNVRSYSTITYKNIYPNIDLVYRQNASGVKYDLIVNPGGNVSDIRLQYAGAENMSVTSDGKMQIANPLGKVQEDVPYTYQMGMSTPASAALDVFDSHKDGAVQTVSASYKIKDNVVTFDIAAYDRTRPLVIDPTLAWCTFYGGSDQEELWGLCLDGNSNVFVTGTTKSTDFPVTTGAFQTTYLSTSGEYYGDVFVVKFDGNGNRKWATYYGDSVYTASSDPSIAADASGNVFISGTTISSTFPVTTGAFQTSIDGGYGNGAPDVFIVKLDNSGARLWATFFGGNSDEYGGAIAVDSSGNVVIGGSTQSSNLATAGAFQTAPSWTIGYPNGFLAKFDGNGNQKWATYYGGDAKYGGDFVAGIAIDKDGNIAVTGSTGSSNFPVTAGAFQNSLDGPFVVSVGDAFVGEFDANGSMKWSTYYGGSNGDVPYGLATDINGNVYIAGYTFSTNFPISNGAYQTTFGGGETDAFLVKFDGSGNRKWATYYGGSKNDYGTAVTTDINGNVFFTGSTPGGNFSTTSDAYQSGIDAQYTGAIVEFDEGGNRKWATEFGSITSKPKDFTESNTIAIDPNDNIYIAGNTNVDSANFPITQGAFQTHNNGSPINNGVPFDAFVAKFCNLGFKTPLDGPDTICRGSGVTIGSTGNGGSASYTYSWSPTKWLSNPSSAMTVGTPDSTITYTETVTDGSGCSKKDSVRIVVHQLPVAHAGPDQSICYGVIITIGGVATGGTPPYKYLWSPTTGLNDPTKPMPSIANPTTTTTYTVTVTDSNGCQGVDSMTLTVDPLPIAHAGPNATICRGDTAAIGQAATGGLPPYTYSWHPANSTLTATNALSPGAYPDTTTKYYVTVTDANGCTSLPDSVIVKVNSPPILNSRDRQRQEMCQGIPITLGGSTTGGTPPYTFQWSPPDGLSATNVESPTANPQVTTTYTVVVTDANGCKDRSTFTVVVNPVPTPHILAEGPLTLCAGDSTILSTDGTYFSYLWSDGETTPTITVYKSGIYTVTVENTYGCPGTSPPETVYVRPVIPTPKVTVTGDTTFCSGGSVMLTAPPGFTSYVWTINGTQSSTMASITATQSGVYTVTVMNDSGCTQASTPVMVTVHPLPMPLVVGPSAVCINSTISYTVSDTAVSGTNDTYVWKASPGGTITSGNGTKIVTIHWSGAGTENVTVTETTPDGCTDSSQPLVVTVGSSLKPEIAVSGSLSLCGGDSVVLDGGKGFATYLWNTGATTETITVTQPGAYTVSVTDGTGCSGTSDTVMVTAGKGTTPVITGLDTVCTSSTGMYAVTNVPGDTYVWMVTGGAITAGQGTSNITVTWGGRGNGSVSITETHGTCMGNATESVSIGNGVAPAIAASGALSFCTGDSVTLSAPAGFATYLWSDGETTQSIVVRTSGTYTVTVTSVNGCSGTSSPVTITVGSSLVPAITGAPAFCPGDSTVLDAGAGYGTYLWNTGATTETIVVKAPGTYSVSVTKGTCAGSSANFTVTEYPAPTATITVSGDTLISSPAASYQWNMNEVPIAGATQQRYVAVSTGSYTVTITDANGCTVSSPAYIQSTNAVDVCIDASPSTVSPNGFMTATMYLTNEIFLPIDSLVFDLHFDPRVMDLDSIGESPCSVSAKYIAAGEVRIRLEACSTPLPAGALCTAVFTPLVSSSDTAYTQLAVDSIAVYPLADSLGGSGCSVPVTVLPLCGLHGVIYTGATSLAQNYPNPFTGTTAIHVTLSQNDAQNARLVVCNVLGEQVADLTSELSTDGNVTFSAGANKAGVYYYVLQTVSGIMTRQMFVVK